MLTITEFYQQLNVPAVLEHEEDTMESLVQRAVEEQLVSEDALQKLFKWLKEGNEEVKVLTPKPHFDHHEYALYSALTLKVTDDERSYLISGFVDEGFELMPTVELVVSEDENRHTYFLIGSYYDNTHAFLRSAMVHLLRNVDEAFIMDFKDNKVTIS